MFLRSPVLLLPLLCLLLASCAQRGAPTGGPRDQTPPEVVATEPPSGSTNVGTPSIAITFNDYVDRGVRSAVTVQPSATFSVDYAGDVITVNFTEPLRDSTTYVVVVGTDFKNTRGVAPAQARSIVIATGPTLDSGRITGTVAWSSMENIAIFCYPLDGDSIPDPTLTSPPYRIPVGSSGSFRIDGLRRSTYRLVAVQDANRNGRYDGGEAFVTAPRDVTVGDTTETVGTLRMGPAFDRTPPAITRVRALSRRRLDVVASEPIRTSALRADGVTLQDSTGATATVAAVWQPTGQRDHLSVLTQSDVAPGRWTLDLGALAITDTAGNALIDSTRRQRYTVTDIADTVGLAIRSVSIADSAKTVRLHDTLRVALSDAVDTSRAVLSSVVTIGADTIVAPTAWVSPDALQASLPRPLQADREYRWTLRLRSLVSPSGRTMDDTTVVRTFRTEKRSDPGSISGVFVDSSGMQGPFLLRLLDEKGTVLRALPVTDGAPIVVDSVPSTTIRADVLVDRNGNGRYDHGTLVPWTPSEIIVPLAATLQVRPRWALENVRFVLPADMSGR